MEWKNLLPKRRAYIVPDGRVASVRWGSFGWDHFESDRGFKYTQWGSKLPLSFVCRFKAETGMPLFLLGPKWTRLKTTRTMVAGTTESPLELGKLWSKLYGR